MKRRGLMKRITGGIRESLRQFILTEENFAGAQVNRLVADWVTMGGMSADETMKGGIRRLRSRARDLGRNNPYVSQYLNLLSVNIIGASGFDMTSTVRDPAGNLLEDENTALEEAWYSWANEPITVDGKQDFVALSHLIIKTVARDGEVFIRLWRGFEENRFGLALEPIDADLVDETYERKFATAQNEIRMGVEVNRFGRPLYYHKFDRVDSTGPRNRERVPADQILHLYIPERVQQSRGVPWISPVMIDLRMLAGYFEAELVASRAGAAKMGFWQRKDGTPPDTPSGTQEEMEANPGTIDYAPEGYEFTSWNPDHPTGAFPEFTRAVLRECAAGLHVSYPSLTGDLADVNFSSMRGGYLNERDYYRVIQFWLAGAFNRVVYAEWLKMAILKGEVATPSLDYRKYLSCAWTPRGWGFVDPEKDVNADVTAIKNGLASRTDVLRAQGRDYLEVLDELAEEETAAKKKGVTINSDLIATAAPDAGSNSPNGNGTKPPKKKARTFEIARRF